MLNFFNLFQRVRREGIRPHGPLSDAVATTSEIPDLFFDEILPENNLNHEDITVLMYLYRNVWCRPNLYKEYGISGLISISAVAKKLQLPNEGVKSIIQKLEHDGFVETIAPGQFFVRKYFTKKNDARYGQLYDSL